MKNLVIANWKCNPITQNEAKIIFGKIKKGTKGVKRVEVLICPPFAYLPLLKGMILGGQNCYWEQKGAFTGEASPAMLKSADCAYVIIGHSERRKYFGETNETVNKKLKAALEAKLSPILCVGETQQQRDNGETEKVLRQQVITAFDKIPGDKISKKFSVAYEPVWAIGTGNPCDPDEAQKMGLLIRKIISEIYNPALAKKIRILYGGSVNSKNAASYVKEAGLQGLLVGGASLIPEEFVKIVKSAN